jgi:hypothetical protein
MAVIHKRARERLEQLREENRAESERLLDAFGEALAGVREALGVSPGEQDSGTADATGEVCARAGRLVLGALGQAGGVAALSAAHETVTAHHGNDYLPLVERFCRSSRPALSSVLEVLVLRSASADRSLLEAVRFLRASPGADRRVHPGTPRRQGSRPVVRAGGVAHDHDRPAAAGPAGPPALRGVRVFLPGGRAALRRHRGDRVGVVRQLRRPAAELGGMRAADRRLLHRGGPAGRRGRGCGAAAAGSAGPRRWPWRRR